jgi:hypothetical protein
MGISLNGLTPAGTYPGLIKTGDNTAISGTPKVLSDGNGNNLPMEVSTTGVNFTNQLQQGGVAVPTASQVAAKQDTLVSGTNIKTINGTSVLGSGNIVTPSTPPSGVSGAIQFSNGSAFASDAANLFWDNTNKRLGVGTNAPNTALQVVGQTTISSSDTFADLILSPSGAIYTGIKGRQYYIDIYSNATRVASWRYDGQSVNKLSVGGTVGNPMPTPQVQIQGSGSTSATTSLLVQNSAGSEALKVRDDRVIIMAGLPTSASGLPSGALWNNSGVLSVA